MSEEETPEAEIDEVALVAEQAQETSKQHQAIEVIQAQLRDKRDNPPTIRLTRADINQMLEAAYRRLPRVHAALKKSGARDHEIKMMMLRLNAMSYDEDALLKYLELDVDENDSKALVKLSEQSLERRKEIIKHSLIRWWNKKALAKRLLYLFGWGSALLGPAIHAGLTWLGAIGIGIVGIMRIQSVWKDMDHNESPERDSNHRARQLKLERLISELQQWMKKWPSERERQRLQADVLELINSLVRDHRSDKKGRQIYTNLLIRQGQAVVVIARSELMRPVPEIYTPEQCSLAWRTLHTGAPSVTGDVYKEAPKTKSGKRYSSILVLPVKSGTQVIGAVSIDSECKYHFDSVYVELLSELAPYVQLLAITLTEDHDTSASNREPTDGDTSGGNTGNTRSSS